MSKTRTNPFFMLMFGSYISCISVVIFHSYHSPTIFQLNTSKEDRRTVPPPASCRPNWVPVFLVETAASRLSKGISWRYPGFMYTFIGVSSSSWGYSQMFHGWLISGEIPIYKWMITRGTPMLRNPHMSCMCVYTYSENVEWEWKHTHT